MKLLILAAGKGSRLQPLTNNKPKCLVEFMGIPLLEWQLRAARELGIKNLGIVGGFMAHRLKEYDLKIFINGDYSCSNMVYSLYSARDFIDGSDDLIISYGDIIYEKSVLAKLMESKGDISIMVDVDWAQLWGLRFDDPLSDAETCVIQDNEIKELGSKTNDITKIHGQYIGLIKICKNKIKQVIDIYELLLNETKSESLSYKNMYMTDYIQLLINNQWKVQAVCAMDFPWHQNPPGGKTRTPVK